MNYNEKTMLYSEDKELTIKAQKAFPKKNIKDFKTVCNIEEENDKDEFVYKVSKISDYNRFLYFVAREIVNSITNTYFKDKLKESFKDWKKVFDNHQNYSYENSHFEFFVKARLLFFFKFNEILNIPTFIKFNCNKIFEEYDLIIETEIEAGGCLYDQTGEVFTEGEPDEFLTNRYNNLFKYISGKVITGQIEDIHIFKDGVKLYIINEKGTILNSGQTGIDYTDLKDFYISTCDKTATDIDVLGFYLGVVMALYNPERIIIYSSLDEDFKTQILLDFNILKQVLGIQTEYFTSEEKKPRL